MGKISRKNWILIWVLGMAGQICWNIENSWFNNFVYDKIAPEPAIVSWMVGVSAVVSTFCTFLVGTWGDRIGKRKPFICIGYIFWGLFTFLFGATELIPKNPLFIAAAAVVLADAVMSFFGSLGNDGGFSPWTTDISNEQNRGKLGGVLAVMPVFATIFGAVVSGILIEALDFFAFFGLMGAIVAAMGFLALFTLQDSPGLAPKRDEKGFLHQFLSVFNWNTVRNNQELFWVFMMMTVYFIGFNVYFPYITIYFVNYLGYDYGMTGVIQGVGLLAASVLTIPAAKLIDKGKMALVIFAALLCNTAGLVFVSFSQQLIVLLIGVFGAGIGYILVLQTLTAWMKNLYPEEQRGQFEGLKQIFFVCIPMIVGPAIATPIINRLGIPAEINGASGMIPAPSLFLISAILTLFTLIPLNIAAVLHKKNMS
ncbi:MAG: MFS transporter [Clostridium sp.]|nr:MFS transporter [Clostridium sp.]